MRGYRWADRAVSSFDDMKRKVPQSVAACFAVIEASLLKGPWVMGEMYTVTDTYLFTLAQWLEADGVDIARLPRVIEHRSRVAERGNVIAKVRRPRPLISERSGSTKRSGHADSR